MVRGGKLRQRERARRPRARPCAWVMRIDCKGTRGERARDRACLLDVSQNPVELVETVVAHHELALAAAALLDRDAGTELVRELALEALDIRVGRRRAIPQC